MRIERILLRDVGPFDDVTIEFPAGKDPERADVYLLTGQNGTGKSTILYALGALISGGEGNLGNDLLYRRMRSKESIVAFATENMTVAGAPRPASQPRRTIPNPLGDGQLVLADHNDVFGYYHSTVLPNRYSRIASHFGSDHLEDFQFEWAAFAYAGLRSVSEGQVTAVRASKTNPFMYSLTFVVQPDTSELVNWIAYQRYRHLLAKDAGHDDQAEQFAQSIKNIELAIADIIDDPSFAFVITDENDDVRVRWRGITIRMGLLPDGLKSIVSWVADLLMRLDRIPWQDNIPVLQRSFLLLLDEIDIHLHPAWQRKVLPLAQRMFPNAQIIASTHSPFVVGSMADGRIITLGIRGSSAFVEHESDPQIGVSYSVVLRSIFGIESEFDVDTEDKLRQFHDARKRLLTGDESARAELDRIADELKQRSEELRGLIALELGQLRRQLAQLAQRAAP